MDEPHAEGKAGDTTPKTQGDKEPAAAVGQRAPAPNSGASEQEATKKEKPAKQIDLPAWIQAGCAVLLVIITGFYTYYAAKQTTAAIKAADAAKSAADTAYRTLLEQRKENAASVASANDQFSKQLARLDASIQGQNRLAKAAEGNLANSRTTLATTQDQFAKEVRPFLGPFASQVAYTADSVQVSMTLQNAGRSPAVDVKLSETLTTYDPTDRSAPDARQAELFAALPARSRAIEHSEPFLLPGGTANIL